MAAVGLPLPALPLLGLIGVYLVRPLYQERYVLFAMLGLALLIGGAWRRRAGRRTVGVRAPARPGGRRDGAGGAVTAVAGQGTCGS
ncbi:hypothetical protein ABT270_14580 [Streptomyces sp900105245]|uniref:hypothetical protein n=1 Tax=unclassified Streptomyces TaxID=2593676 RepID=UPI003333621F